MKTLVNSGVKQNMIRMFLEETGAYCADVKLMKSCIEQGRSYKRALNFEPESEDELDNCMSHNPYQSFYQHEDSNCISILRNSHYVDGNAS